MSLELGVGVVNGALSWFEFVVEPPSDSDLDRCWWWTVFDELSGQRGQRDER
jgi:hypothetical protein